MAADNPVATVVTRSLAPNGLGEGRLFVTNRSPEGLNAGIYVSVRLNSQFGLGVKVFVSAGSVIVRRL